MKGRMRIAVIGSGGQVGSELVGLDWSSYLAEHKVDVISVTRAELRPSASDSRYAIGPFWCMYAQT